MAVPLGEALDKSHWVETQTVGGTVYLAAWNGGHTINTYRVTHTTQPRADPLECYSVGDFAKDAATLSEVRLRIQTWKADLRGDGRAEG